MGRSVRPLRAAGIPRALAEGLIAKIAAIPDAERSLGIPLLAAPAGEVVTRATEETVLFEVSKAAAERLVLFWRGQTRSIPEDGTQIVVGRSSQCQFVLDIASASRRHAAVSRQDGVFVVEDLSRNGTYIAVPGVAEPQRLTPGEPLPLPPRGEIVIGSAELGEEPARIAWEIVKR